MALAVGIGGGAWGILRVSGRQNPQALTTGCGG